LRNGDIRLGDGFLERIKVTDDNIDLFNLLFGKILFIAFDITGQDTYGYTF
jgi:hypothetical protein